MHILFYCKDQKSVLGKEIKDWTFQVYLLNREPSSWFLLIESLKMTGTRSYTWFLNFFFSIGGLDCILQLNALPKLSKIIVTCPKLVKSEQVGSIWTCSKSGKWLSILNFSKSAKWPVWKSIYLWSWRS